MCIESRVAETPLALQLCNIRRHAATPGHIAAVAAYLGKPVVPTVNAPSLEDFKQIIADRKASKRFTLGNDAIGGEKKVERMTWCAAEAHLDMRREFIRTARVISIFQDASGHRMSVRYSASNGSLDCVKGQLRLVHNVQPGSIHSEMAARDAIDKFATARLDGKCFGARPMFEIVYAPVHRT